MRQHDIGRGIRFYSERWISLAGQPPIPCVCACFPDLLLLYCIYSECKDKLYPMILLYCLLRTYELAFLILFPDFLLLCCLPGNTRTFYHTDQLSIIGFTQPYCPAPDSVYPKGLGSLQICSNH